ncbi:hypothetical protein [Novosphingobium sp.]|uniref:hypothetical protein n=1 Tax=Novosphingobium sp. TaxID=1874826 RepID=UPI00286B7F09|nr:hypothetical protein [Novosphingobium sp.]
MDSKNRAKWACFGEIFEAVAQQGIDELDAVEALLAALRNGLRAYGYRRQFTFNESGKVERLPRDIYPQPVPVAIWRDSGTPKGDLTSIWQDDPEEPEVWISIDWVSGAVESLDWELTNFEHLRTDFSAIRIPRKEADHLLSDLAGRPKKRAGRPLGPSSPWEKEQVAAALRMIDGGDTRPATAIATGLTDTALIGKALESQQRRLTWGIKTALTGNAKNSANNKRD